MRFFGVLLLFGHFLFTPLLFAQTRDTVFTIQDSARHAVQETVKKEFERWQDSVRAVRVKEEVKKHGKSLDAFLQEMHEREKAQRRQLYIRIGLGVALLIVLIAGLIRHRIKT